MKLRFYYFLIFPAFSGCFLSISHDVRVHREKVDIRNNVLITRQHQSTFRKVWGLPDRTYSQSGSDPGFGAQWNGGDQHGRFPLRPSHTYDLWFYSKQQVTLVFDDELLIAWAWGVEPQFVAPKNAAH
jgi:hypothetical protein